MHVYFISEDPVQAVIITTSVISELLDNGWMDGWMVGWLDEWTDRWMDGRVDGWMEEWMDGWIYRYVDRYHGVLQRGLAIPVFNVT